MLLGKSFFHIRVPFHKANVTLCSRNYHGDVIATTLVSVQDTCWKCYVRFEKTGPLSLCCSQLMKRSDIEALVSPGSETIDLTLCTHILTGSILTVRMWIEHSVFCCHVEFVLRKLKHCLVYTHQ